MRKRWLNFVALPFAVILPGPADAQEVDAAAMIRVALTEFDASSDVIEVLASPRCPGEPRVPTICSAPLVEAILSEFASDLRAVLQPNPLAESLVCPWSVVESTERKGLRLAVSEPRGRGDRRSVNIDVRCHRPEIEFGSGYFMSREFLFRLEDGEWKYQGEGITIVS